MNVLEPKIPHNKPSISHEKIFLQFMVLENKGIVNGAGIIEKI